MHVLVNLSIEKVKSYIEKKITFKLFMGENCTTCK